jgi:hypothetical protein
VLSIAAQIVRPQPAEIVLNGVDATIVIRGGPDTLAKLTMHARRTHDAYVLDGEPLWGISCTAR